MNRKLFITSVSVLVLTIGLSWTVFGKGFYKLEAFASLPKEKQTLIIDTLKKSREQNANKLHELHNRKYESMTKSVIDLAPQFTQEEREVLVTVFKHGRYGYHTKKYE